MPPPDTVPAQRIIICCHDFSRGGTERIAIGLARYWASVGREVSFLVGTTEGGLRESLAPNVGVTELSPPIRRSLLSRFRLGTAMAAEITRLRPDIVFLPGNFHLQLCIPISAAQRRNFPPEARAAIVYKMSNPITPHGIWAPLLRAVIRRFQHCIDGVAAMNSGLERELTRIIPPSPTRHTAMIRTLFDPAYLNHDTEYDHIAHEDGHFHVVWAGRLEPQKDAMLALRVAQMLRERLPPSHLRLTLLGTGSQQAMVNRAILRMGLSDVITTMGHVPSIDPWLRQADALLVTSHFEGGPAVAVEALAHGVPVVSTDCSHFLHDIMAIPEAGRIVPSRTPEALAAALLDLAHAAPADASRLSSLIAHLEPDICAEAYLTWFDDVIRERNRRAQASP